MRTGFLICLLVAVARADDALAELRNRIRTAKDQVFPALVHIVNVEETFVGGRRQKEVSTGSGFLIDADGHVVTNYHVAGKGKILIVSLASKRKIVARLVAGDVYTDLALLKVDPQEAWPDGKPVFARFGDSRALQEGDFVMAMGSPLSLSRSVSFGIISCRDRALGRLGIGGEETGKYHTWLQTDAAINPGNSGGPLVNLAGEVVGVNTRANLAADNIGFAIPSDVVREVVDALLEHAAVPRAYLGLGLQPLEALEDTALAAGEEGVLVAAVANGSPAARAGVRPGDIVLRLDGAPVAGRFPEQIPELYRRISKLAIARPVPLAVRRGGALIELEVRPEALGRQLGRETEVGPWGITVRAITAKMRVELSLPDDAGVLVTGVRAGSPAASRLERGDIIRSVQGEPVADLTTFLKLAADTVRAKEALVRLTFRRGSVLDVTVLRLAEESR